MHGVTILESSSYVDFKNASVYLERCTTYEKSVLDIKCGLHSSA
jgi:hypothetical protein